MKNYRQELIIYIKKSYTVAKLFFMNALSRAQPADTNVSYNIGIPGYSQVRWINIGYVAGHGRFQRMRFLPVNIPNIPAIPYLDTRVIAYTFYK